MSDEVNAEVNKNGERKVTVAFLRTSAGITVTVRALKEIEEFFANQARESISVREFGNDWMVKEKELRVWLLANDPGVVNNSGLAYGVDRVGKPLVYTTPAYADVVNLSVLRLVGISEPAGVSFTLRGAYTLPHLQDLSQKVVRATRQFYIDFFQPIHIEVGIVGSVIRL